MAEKTIEAKLVLTEQEAIDLAQFHKRANFADFRTNAADDDEAYRMIHAAGKLRKALAAQGIDPR
jgi:hypothetical protein